MTPRLTFATVASLLALAAAAPPQARAAEGDQPPKTPEIINPSEAPAEAKPDDDKKNRGDGERGSRNREAGERGEQGQQPDAAEREQRRESRDRDRRTKVEEATPSAPVKQQQEPKAEPPPVEAAKPAPPPPQVEKAKEDSPPPPAKTTEAPHSPPPAVKNEDVRKFDRRNDNEATRTRDNGDNADRRRPRGEGEGGADFDRETAPQQQDVAPEGKPERVEAKRPTNIFQDRTERMRSIQDQWRAAGSRKAGARPPFATLEYIKSKRKERREDGGKRLVIEEPDNRTIIQQDNRIAIERNERERMRRFAPNARIERGPGKNSIAVVERGPAKIFTETDDRGRLVRRYRRDPSGRETIIIDNRRRKKDKFGRDLAIGAGIGAGVVAGAVLLDSLVRVPPPRVLIPRDKYVVRGSRASEDDYYEALSAPPVDRYDDRYTLDEIRATAHLRERMRRVDLDDITFEFGAWDIDPSQYRKLDRLARAIKRVLRRDPDEVFMIEGHTDAVGSRVDNLTLSDRRAETIAYILTREFDVPFESLVTQGYGEEYLKIPTLAPERLNRRVAAIRLTPLLDRDYRGARLEDPPRTDRRDDRGEYDRRDDAREEDDRDYRDGRRDDRGYDEPDDDRYDDRRGPSPY
ncbi:MAG: OmpA family protein [Hyphomicrobium sp.]